MEFVRLERLPVVGSEGTGYGEGDPFVALVTIDRPKALNALNAQVLTELDAAFAGAVGARSVVLTGGGAKAFVAGADIAAMKDLDQSSAAHFAGVGQQVFDRIQGFPAPVIAAVNGFALGGGCELALACDLVLAAPNALFGQPEVNLGVIPGFGGTQRLVRRIGAMRAAELIYSGRNVKAEEAVAIGLALRVADPVLDAALALARQIASRGPLAVQFAKRAVGVATDATLREGELIERDLFGLCFATADQKEGMAAFLEKRTAAFTGA
jgi:enoyl-CoA hydratase